MEFRLILLVLVVSNVSATGEVFRVQHKFDGQERSLKALKEHDIRRHGRVLAAVDLPLGGEGNPTGIGLYYTKIAIGSPPKDYFVDVDTGSDIFWVNCIQCKDCPKKSSLGVDLKLYDPQSSSTGQLVKCDTQFCSDINKGLIPGCLLSTVCAYDMFYGDGSRTTGYFVKDFIALERVSGNLQTTSTNAVVTFGCGVQQTGNLIQSKGALDGILGFGASKASMLSQLASSGIVRKTFSHCLDGVNGGGIFAIGNVVQPQVQTTPLIPDQSHYNVNMESITVGKTTLQIPSSVSGTRAVIDSGTTLSYLPRAIYEPLINAITSSQPDLNVVNVRINEEHLSCFQFNRSVDDGFPAVTFQFANSLALVVYPHDYLVKNGNEWCIGWQNGGKLSKEMNKMILLGDLVLSSKLVTYDLENHTIGWIEYNCSSTIKIQDGSGSEYELSSHNLSPRSRIVSSDAQVLYLGRVLMLLFLTVLMHILVY